MEDQIGNHLILNDLPIGLKITISDVWRCLEYFMTLVVESKAK